MMNFTPGQTLFWVSDDWRSNNKPIIRQATVQRLTAKRVYFDAEIPHLYRNYMEEQEVAGLSPSPEEALTRFQHSLKTLMGRAQEECRKIECRIAALEGLKSEQNHSKA